MGFVPEWNNLNKEEKEELINPLLEKIKEKIINAKSVSISNDLEWSKGEIVSRIIAETYNLEIRHY